MSPEQPVLEEGIPAPGRGLNKMEFQDFPNPIQSIILWLWD